MDTLEHCTSVMALPRLVRGIDRAIWRRTVLLQMARVEPDHDDGMGV